MISKWKYIWWPVAVLNQLRHVLRNRLFDLGVWKSVEFEVPVIYLGAMADEPTIALSGYLQKITQGAMHVNRFQLAQLGFDKQDLHNYYTSLSVKNVFCTNHKVLGISEWYQNNQETPAFVMDRESLKNEIRPQLRVMVTDFARPFSEDEIYPVGKLTMPKYEAENAEIILVVNTPSDANIEKMESNLLRQLNSKPTVFFIKNSIQSLKSFNSVDKIEFISDRDNFERLILNILPNANPDSE